MDSTAEDSRDSKRARLAPPPPLDDDDVDVDRISGLNDDVLLHILGLVGDARDVVRTGALSRRWLGLWTRVPALRFAPSRPPLSIAGLERYLSIVNDVLARRSQSDCAVESLAISYAAAADYAYKMAPTAMRIPVYTGSVPNLTTASVDAVQGWLRYASQYRVKSLDVDLTLPPPLCLEHWGWRDNDIKPAVFLDEIPAAGSPNNPVRMEAMRLALGGLRLRLSDAVNASFASLTELSLEDIEMEAGGGGAGLLARLVSSSTCPRLQKLRMSRLCLGDDFDEETTMRIEAKALSELRMEHVQPLGTLKLRTPALRVLHLHDCYQDVLRTSAPRLEEVALLFYEPRQPPRWRWLDVDGGLPCVRRLKLGLWARPADYYFRRGEAENYSSIRLLEHCSSSLACLDVTLDGTMLCELDVDMIKRRVPHLPQVTSLTINISDTFLKLHNLGVGVASLLTRFNHLRRLSLHKPFIAVDCNTNRYILCDHPNHWKSNELSMDHLQEAELTGLIGTDCELWFIEAMLASAKRIRRVVISFNVCYRESRGKMDAVERLLVGARMWPSHRDTFNLTCIRY